MSHHTPQHKTQDSPHHHNTTTPLNTHQHNTHNTTQHALSRHTHGKHSTTQHTSHCEQNTSTSRLKAVCHPRVMSRSLPHLSLTTSTSSLSTSSPIILSSSPTFPDLLTQDPHLPLEDSRRSGGITHLPLVTSPRELSSTGILKLNVKIYHKKNYGR